MDYGNIIKKYPWLIQKDIKCIISPDADGMLCGLFMSNYLNWKIVGYYDNGKNLILKNKLRAEDCVFLDTEIYRENIKSMGHHISLLRNENTDIDIKKYSNCLNPNFLRDRTLKNGFSLKYPMGTIHLLICIVGHRYPIKYLSNSFFAVLQADGTINRFVDKYSENLRDWLEYLGIDKSDNTLNKILKREINLIDLNKEYVEYVKKFVKSKGDKIPVSNKGILQKESFNKNFTEFSSSCIGAVETYLKFLSETTGWEYKKGNWTFEEFRLYEFNKKIVKPGVGTFNTAVRENFLSLAITANDTMEYTIEKPDKLP
ncbi:MAG: hypothetical protein WC309_01990 [Candidatus Paceibacterota bacterium]|jgi:hypothetical protein